MGNILGNPFDDWVQTQIDVRQKSLGKYSNIPSKDLQYYTTKTPFIKLASSVNLTNLGEDSVLQKLLNLGIPESLLSEDKLAKNLILQGGAVNATETNNNLDFGGLKFGLNNGGLLSGSYGYGGIEERGYVPLPGITNADVTYYNNGALSKTIINIKCFSKSQFQLLDVLYLRPGYTLLLEFGWSQYLNDNGDLQSFDSFTTPPMSDFLNPNKNGANVDQYSLYKTIEETRKQYRGNYEAIFGKVTNFNWQFNPDGSYDCQVQLTAVGDVIESLKINIASPTLNQPIQEPTEEDNGESSQDENTPGETQPPPLVANQNSTLINKKLHEIYQSVSFSQFPKNSRETVLPFSVENFRGEDGFKSITFEKGLLLQKNLISNEGGFDFGYKGYNPQVYIKYGAFLAYLQSELSLYNSKGNPLFTFDINFDNLNEDENYILTIPGQISADPGVCLIPLTNFNIADDAGNPIFYPGIELLNNNLSQTGFNVDGEPYLARVANIMVNINYIAEILDQTPRDEDNNINLLNFLDSLNKGLIDATGNINEYTLKLDQSGLKIQFQEDIPQRFNKRKENKEFAKFNVFGVEKGGIGGSFIRNINLTSELSSDFATMISIGAQSNSNQVSGNATSFSNYNKGLIDRIIPEKISSSDSQSNIDDISKNNELANLILNIRRLYSSIYGINAGGLSPQMKYSGADIASFKSQISTALSLTSGILCTNGQLQAPFFLPFNLKLDMDGLSGMKLYEKFRITENILPPSYDEDSVDTIIKGINHSIDTTSWTTKLDTLSTPRPKVLAIANTGSSGVPLSLLADPFPDPLPPPGPEVLGEAEQPLSPIRREAMLSSYNGVFGRDRESGPDEGLCARWTWNLALNYINFLRGGKLKSPKQNSGGNARDPEFHNKLTRLGYQKFVTKGLTRDRLGTLLANPANREGVSVPWGYGDVVVYYCNERPPAGTEDSHYIYGHAQIYKGDIPPTQPIQGGKKDSAWATDKKTNYGFPFVYGTRTGDNWNLIVFRAPSGVDELKLEAEVFPTGPLKF
jgi:hypothetical protein